MAYVVIGAVLIVLELYRLALDRTHVLVMPQVLRLGIPLVLLVGFWRGERTQRPAVVLTALCFAFGLNRGLIPGRFTAAAITLLTALSLVWVGVRLRAKSPGGPRGGWWAVGAVLSAFAIAWTLQSAW